MEKGHNEDGISATRETKERNHNGYIESQKVNV